MKRKTKIIFLSIVAVIVIITGGIVGGKYYLDKKEKQIYRNGHICKKKLQSD